MKIVIAGGTGFVGNFLASEFNNIGHEVVIISRRKGQVQWTNQIEIKDALENAELLINLAGKSVNCRYNEKNRREILESRVLTTRILGESILKCENPPKLWINSSTATIYRHAEDRPMDENTGEIGEGFSVNVAKSWENAFFSFGLPKTRQVALRMAIVLGNNGGVMRPYRNLVKFGLGGRQGNGKQKFSWIHIEDLFKIIMYLYDHAEMKGIYNCSSPHPVSNEELMKTFRSITKTKIGLRSPEWMLKVGALIIKTETELILKSRWVVPDKLLKAGYVFKYPFLIQALENIIERPNKFQSI